MPSFPPAKTRVKATGYLPGPPPRLAWTKLARRPDGVEKMISHWTEIADEELSQRMAAEVRVGDELEITSITEWGEGYTRTYLTDFVILSPKQSAAAPSPAQEAARARPK
jgi:hypothetical protein